MVGLSQHELAKFLVVTLQPVLELYSSFCIQDSFLYAELIRQFDPKSDQSFLCSFDICSLFSNVPLDETVRICADTLYSGKFISPDFPKAVFIELMQMTTWCSALQLLLIRRVFFALTSNHQFESLRGIT